MSSPPATPSDVLGTGSTLESLRTSTRFAQSSDHSLVQLAKDFESEDLLLEVYIEQGRLDQWWKGVAEAALQSAKDELEHHAEDQQRRNSVDRAFWKRVNPDEPGQEGQDNLEVMIDRHADVLVMQ